MKKPIIVIAVLTIGLLFIGVTACTKQKDSTEGNTEPTMTPIETSNEVYENVETGIGLVFPLEYKDKYTVQPDGNVSFTVTQKSTGKVLFKVRRFITLNPADGFSGDGQEDLLLQAGNSVYVMIRHPADNDNMDSLNDKEYTELISDTLLDEIISGSYALESDNPVVSYGASPVYSALARMSIPDGGMQEDFVYTLPDGCVNPALNVPLLFINGSFTAKGTGLLPDGKIELGKTYIPAKLIAEEFGGTANWNPDSQSMTIRLKGHEFLFTVDSVIAFYDGKEVELTAAPILENDCVYVAGNDDVYKYFSLEVGYMPDFEFPSFANNPIVTIDEIGSVNKSSGETIQELKDYVVEQLIAGLENAKKDCVGTYYESAMLNAAPEIMQKINNLSVLGNVSKYLMMDGPYQILVDIYTKDIYFYISGHGICFVKKADINDPYLFIPSYVGDF